MGGSIEKLRERVREAWAQMAAAEREGDVYEAAAAEPELEDVLRIARAHGVDIKAEGHVDGSAV